MELIINLYVRKEKFQFLIFMPVHFTPMRWENGSPFEKYLDALLGKRPMKAIISESKLFPSMLSLFAVKRRQVCEGIQINLLSNQIGTLCRSLEGNNTRLVCVQMNKGGKFLKKLWCYVGGRVQQVPYRSDEGLTLETSTILLFTLVSLHFQLSC